MNILFYYPDRERAVSLSSLMIAFKLQGHKVFLLTHAESGALHEDVIPYGIETFSNTLNKNNSWTFYLRHLIYLVSFTKRHKIDLVYSHIQKANFISAVARYFSPSRFILCRHHSDCAFVDNNFNEKMLDKIINRLGKEFIVPSQKVYDQMTIKENVRNKKIYLIRYAYNFDAYSVPDVAKVAEIRKTYQASLLLVKVARLISEKRHLLLLRVVLKLINEGMDIKLVLLSEGPEQNNIIKYISENNLQERVFLTGYKNDVMNYLAAADLIVHVSESEASSNLAKEVGLLKKPLLVCHDVGDFDEYLIHTINSLLINKENAEAELEVLLRAIYKKELTIGQLGKNLYKVIFERFSIVNLLPEYTAFHTG